MGRYFIDDSSKMYMENLIYFVLLKFLGNDFVLKV